MRSNKAPLIGLIAVLAGLHPATPLGAQEPDPAAEVSASPTPSPGPTASRSRVSFVRLWYVGAPKSPRITASFKAGDQESRVIGSHVRPGRLGSYRMFLPGAYSFIVMDGNLVPDAAGKLPPDASPVTAPVPVTLKSGAFHTLVVEEKNGRMGTSVIDDDPLKPETGSGLRVFDYTGSTADSVRMTCNEKEFEIWNSSRGTPFEKSLAGIEGSTRLELVSRVNDKPAVLGAYETTIEPQKSYSLVIYFDRYGQKTFTLVEAASAPVDKAEIDAFLKSR